jgi:hypothetical protein
METLLKRIRAKITYLENGCWVWTGSFNKAHTHQHIRVGRENSAASAYGNSNHPDRAIVTYQGKRIEPTRALWAHEHDVALDDVPQLIRTCKTNLCINPACRLAGSPVTKPYTYKPTPSQAKGFHPTPLWFFQMTGLRYDQERIDNAVRNFRCVEVAVVDRIQALQNAVKQEQIWNSINIQAATIQMGFEPTEAELRKVMPDWAPLEF